MHVMKSRTGHAWVEYDPLIDEFSVQFGTADEIDATELLDDLFLGFDHAEQGRLLSVTALSPGLGKSQGWLEVLRETLGKSLWDAYQKADSEAIPIQDREFNLPRDEESALRAGVWTLRHRELRHRIGDPFPMPREPERPGLFEVIRRAAMAIGIAEPLTERPKSGWLGDEEGLIGGLSPGPSSGLPTDLMIDFGEYLEWLGYTRLASVRLQEGSRLHLTFALAEEDSPAVSLRVRMAQPAGYEGETVVEPSPDSFFAEADLVTQRPLPVEQLASLRLVASPIDNA